MRNSLALGAMLCLFLCACATAPPQAPAATDEPPRLTAPKKRQISSPITDRFAIRGSFYNPSAETLIRIDDQAGLLGTEVLAEEDLGLDDNLTQGRMELLIRMRERNRLRVDYFKTDRDGDQLLARQIDFGDQTFNVNERVQSELNWRMLGFTYTRSVFLRERFEIGVGLGLYLIEASASAQVASRFAREDVDGVGAFPTPIIDATWRISSRWSVTARGQYFSSEVDEFKGSLGDFHADVQYRWRRNFAVGLGYSAIQANLEVNDADFPGLFDLDVAGPELFFRVSF
jgi:hypothetical protein